MTFLGKLATLVLTLFTLGSHSTPAQLGVVSIPGQDALVDTYLASGIAATDTSMTLVTGTTRDGATLTGYYCFTLDANQPVTEYVCGTASGTAITALARGVKMSNPNATSSALAFSHRRFSTAQVTDFPASQFIARKLNGTDTIPNTLQYDTTVTTSTIFSDPRNLVNVETLSNATSTGCVNATTAIKGCVELATGAETAAGTATGGTGATLVPANSTFNASQSSATIVPVTNSSGKLAQAFLDLTAAFTFSGGLTSSGVTTISGTTTLSAASTTITGPVLDTGNWTFTQIPTGPATTPTSSTQLVTKAYVDSRVNTAGDATDGSLAVNTTSTAISITTTATTSSVMHVCNLNVQISDGANSHTFTLNKGNTQGNAISTSTATPQEPGTAVRQLWTSLTAGTYLFTVKHAAGGSTTASLYCTAYVLPQ